MPPKKNKHKDNDKRQKKKTPLPLNKTAVDDTEEKELNNNNNNNNIDVQVEVESVNDITKSVTTNTTNPTTNPSMSTIKNVLNLSSSGSNKALDCSKADFNSVTINSTGQPTGIWGIPWNAVTQKDICPLA